LSELELTLLARALELSFAPGAIVEGVWWPGRDANHRNYRLTSSAPATSSGPRHAVWLIERRGSVYRLRARPADADELEQLLEALREVAAIGPEASPRVAEAFYDCTEHAYELSFTALADMREEATYERWILRRHRDARPLSVGFVRETRRGAELVCLAGRATLRGNPWSD